MRTNELMVGDWVEVIQNTEKHFAQVQMIDGYGDNATNDECLCDAIYYSINELNPIPLTAEILEKNFRADKQWGESGWFINDHIHIYQTTFGVYNIQYMEIVNIQYVHELQHALKLCGNDKNIEL